MSSRKSRPVSALSGVLDRQIVPRDALAASSLTLLLFAGFVKGTPVLKGFPIDLTLLGGALVVMFAVWDLIERRFAVPALGLLLVALWVVFALGIPEMGNLPYATTKVTRLYSLTLISAIGAAIIMRDRGRQLWWLLSVVVLGGTVLAVATINPSQVALESGRLAAEGSNTIAIGRAAGAAAIVFIVGSATRLLPRAPSLCLALVSLGAIVAAGSRGPLLALCVACTVVVIFRPGSVVVRARRVLLAMIAALLLGGALVWGYGGNQGFERIEKTLAGGTDNSTDTRVTLAREAFSIILEHPWGVGWGNFSSYLPGGGLGVGPVALQYPHNIALEVTAEGGIVAGISLIAVVTWTIVRLARQSKDPLSAILLAIVVFFFVNSLVSGDVNDNRMLFAALAVGLVIHPAKTRDDDHTSEESSESAVSRPPGPVTATHKPSRALPVR